MIPEDKVDYIDFLKKSGFKVTPQRLGILEFLKGNKSHPTADMVYKGIRKKIPNVSFNTVYTTLMKFAEMDIIKTVEGKGGSKRFDPDIAEHGHFVCLKCGRVEDFPYTGDIGKLIPSSYLKKSVSKRIQVEGYCEKCSEKS
jgi:Fur family transcriptional regulator, peroxide stress response regulator